MTHAPPRSATDSARLALACLDLTSLGEQDTAEDIERLCERADGAHGPVAAVCVWPRHAALARRLLPRGIAVAAVANFPSGGDDIEAALRDVGEIAEAGAQEIDVVLPYRRLQQGDEVAVSRLLQAVRAAAGGLLLKVILESGALDGAQVTHAAQLALDAGADFLKTSTGKLPAGASLPAAERLLDAIAAHPLAATRAGFKASGGVRTVATADTYFELVERTLGAQALHASRLRIGASSLLDDIEAVLGGSRPVATPHARY